MKNLNYYGKLLSGELCDGCPCYDNIGRKVTNCYQYCHICDEWHELIMFMDEMSITFEEFMALMEYTELEDTINSNYGVLERCSL